MDFNDYMKNFREKAKMTQEEAAKEIGVAVATIQNWENKRAKPELSNLHNIAKAYKISAKELLEPLLACVEPESIQIEEEENILRYAKLLPDELDYSPIANLKFNKEEMELFMLFALHICFGGDPIEDMLKINNNTIVIANILYKFKTLDLYSILNQSVPLYKLTKKGEFLYDRIRENPIELFNVYKLLINEFLKICFLYNIFDLKKEEIKYIRKIISEEPFLDTYECDKNHSRWYYCKLDIDGQKKVPEHSYYYHSSGYSRNESLEDELRKYVNSAYYKVKNLEFNDEMYIIEKEVYLKKLKFYNEHKYLIDNLEPPTSIEELYIKQVIPTQKAIDLIKCLDENF